MLWCGLTSTPALGATLYVEPDVPDPITNCGTPNAGSMTMAEALAAVEAGGVIQLCDGVIYLDSKNLLRITNLPANVTIRGDDDTVLTAATTMSFAPCSTDVAPSSVACWESALDVFDVFPITDKDSPEGWDWGDPPGYAGQALNADPDTFPMYGSYGDAGERISLLPYRDWDSFVSERELYNPASHPAPNVYVPGYEVYYGPGLFFDYEGCVYQRALEADPPPDPLPELPPDHGLPSAGDACKLYLRTDQAETAWLHGLDDDGTADDGQIDLGSVRVFPPFAWQFVTAHTNERFESLTLENLVLEDVAGFVMIRAHDLVVDGLRVDGPKGVRFKDLDVDDDENPDPPHASDLSRIEVTTRYPRVLHYSDGKDWWTGVRWNNGGNCKGASDQLCTAGIKLEDVAYVDLHDSRVSDVYTGIRVQSSDDVALHHNEVAWAHDDAVSFGGDNTQFDLYRNLVVNSHVGFALIEDGYDSSATALEVAIHHNVVDLGRDLEPPTETGAGTPGAYLGKRRSVYVGESSTPDPAWYGSLYALAELHVEYVAATDSGAQRGAWPALVYNNTFISDTLRKSTSDLVGVAVIEFPERLPSLAETWAGPATWFVNNVVVQERGEHALVSRLVWQPREGMEPGAVADGNVYVQYGSPSPGRKFVDYGALLPGVFTDLPDREVDYCEDQVNDDIGYDGWLWQEVYAGGDGDCYDMSEPGNRYLDLDAFYAGTHTDDARGPLTLRTCTGSRPSCGWDDELYDIFSESQEYNWVDDSATDPPLLMCVAATCTEGLERNSREEAPEDFFGLTFATDSPSSVGYVPAIGMDGLIVQLASGTVPSWVFSPTMSGAVGACASGASCDVGPRP